MTETIFTNATIVLPERVMTGTLKISNGVITEISETSVQAGHDCEGDFLAPGLIELHTDNLERHKSPRPGVDWPFDAAIIGHDAELAGVGITTVFDAMRVGSIHTGTSRYSRYARAMTTQLLAMRDAGHLKISHFLHLRAEICSETLPEELDEFSAADRIGILSLMDHTPGQRQFADIEKYKRYVCGKYGLSDAEYHAQYDRLFELQARLGQKHEAYAVAAAKRFGAVLASHDDTTTDHVQTSASHGIKLAEFPTTIEAAKSCRAHQIAVMMGAPNMIRGQSHSGNVSAGDLAAADLLDIFSSDYVPAALLAAAVQYGLDAGDMAKGLRTVTRAPAQATNLDDRGEIALGKRADLIRFRLIGKHPQVRETWVQGTRVS